MTRERIVEVALALIDRGSASALSMRRVATELGAGTMSLYSHIADKADLQLAVLERVLDGVAYRSDPDARVASRNLAHAVRSHFLAHPATIELLGTSARPRPLVDGLAAAYVDLTARAIPGTTALRMIESVAHYTIGTLLAELYGTSATRPRRERDADFDFGLDALFAGFAVHLGVDPANPPPTLS